MHRDAQGTKADSSLAQARFVRACEGDHVPGCTELALTLAETQPERAERLLSSACDEGSAVACVELGARLTATDPERARAILKPVCTARSDGLNARACATMARCVASPEDAVALHQIACEIGLPTSCLELARAMNEGEGIPKNPQSAAGLYLALCQQASIGAACAQSASLYRAGGVVEANARRAFALDAQACDAGVASSCMRVARDHAEGRGTTKDAHAARDYNGLSCLMGVEQACASSESGDLPQNTHKRVVRAVMRQRQREIKACYERHMMRFPESEGRVGIKLEVRPSGEVASASVVENSLEEDMVAICIANVVKEARFPAFPGSRSMTLTYPFEFSGK